MAWLKKSFSLINIFIKLPRKDKWLVIESWLEILRAVVFLRSPWRMALFHSSLPLQKYSVEETDLPRIAALVKGSASHHLKKITCLELAIALQRVLSRRGIYAPLRIGVQKNTARFEAHAWLESALFPLDRESSDFSILYPVESNL